jgi:hypothetical protein
MGGLAEEEMLALSRASDKKRAIRGVLLGTLAPILMNVFQFSNPKGRLVSHLVA